MNTFRFIGIGVLAIMSCVSLSSCSSDDEDGGDDSGKYKAVDLGLQSGTLWADRNVGADSPEDYGFYYAWGETRPHDFGEYLWADDDFITKYCTNSSYGVVDNKTTLEKTDDPAYVNCGKRWRMPTYSELVELVNKCTWTWTTSKGVNGYTVKGPNGNSIFLPAAGRCGSEECHDAGYEGEYGSNSLDINKPYGTFSLTFRHDEYYVYSYYNRKYGVSVRAVVNK